jgi:hypothetical protein
MMSSYLTSVRQGPELLIGFSRTPDQILADKRKTQGFMAGHWLAQVRFPAPDPEVPPGQTVVEMRLVKWVVDSNGRMNNRNFYESLVDAVHNALSSVDTPATD